MTETVLATITIPVTRHRFGVTMQAEMEVRLVETKDPIWGHRNKRSFHVIDHAFKRTQLINVYENTAAFRAAIADSRFAPGGDPKFWRYDFDDAAGMSLLIWIDSIELGF